MSIKRPGIEKEIEIGISVAVDEPARVILFNDEVHTFEEVINQLLKALRCAIARAEELTWEVHNNGQAVVFEGPIAKCMEVSSVLEEIELMTQIKI